MTIKIWIIFSKLTMAIVLWSSGELFNDPWRVANHDRRTGETINAEASFVDMPFLLRAHAIRIKASSDDDIFASGRQSSRSMRQAAGII